MADLIDLETVGVVIGIVFFTAVMMWLFARMSRYFEYLKMQDSLWVDRDTLGIVHRILEWFWVALMIVVILFIASFRLREVRDFLGEAILRMPALSSVAFILLIAAVCARASRRFAMYLRGELPEKPKKLAPPQALTIAETFIRVLIWIAAAFAAYVGGIALLPLSDRLALEQVLPRLQAPNAATLLAVGVAAFGVFVAVRIVDAIFDDMARRRTRYAPHVAEGFRAILRIAIYAVAIFLLVFLALDLTLDPSRLATFGLFLLAFGVFVLVGVLAARDVIRSALSGLSLMLSDPFSVGDRIRVGGEEMEVVALRLTSTQVRTPRGETVQIPNADLVTQRIANISRTEALELSVTVRVPLDVPHARVEDLLRRAASGIDGVKEVPAPRVLARSVGGGAVEYEVAGLVNSPAKKRQAESQLIFRVQDLCLAEGVRLL